MRGRQRRAMGIPAQAEAVGGNWMMRCRGFRPGTLFSDCASEGAVSETNPRASQTLRRAENNIKIERESTTAREGNTDREDE